ncbi:NEQ526 [Nanoarchaeum equitans Kin4-M]|uniref:NEQ526 n=1 Tax=Nanoarchaeum equitans (strain Kin4-M) TaxID=228908 RepID=Q74M39_NANEQ|nr:NEQ526 [Nanoarchaeum equitans Kin4-M]
MSCWKPLSKEEFEAIVSKYKDNPKIEIDYENLKFIPKFNEQIKKYYSNKIKGAKVENLVNEVYEAWFDYIIRIYERPKEKDILMFLPCAAKKPYYKSKTHRTIQRAISGFQIFNRIHRVIVSNPGIIPWEFHTYWPFNSYDWPEWEETEDIKKLYYWVTYKRVKEFLRRHQYNYYTVYMKPDSLTYKAVMDASKELNIKIIPLLDEKTYEKCKGQGNPLVKEPCIESLKNNLKQLQKQIYEGSNS